MRRVVTITELRSRLDPRAVAFHEEAIEAGVDPGPLKATREYFAVVEYDGKREVWPVSKADAERVRAAFRDGQEAVDISSWSGPERTIPSRMPVAVELDQPLALMPEKL